MSSISGVPASNLYPMSWQGAQNNTQTPSNLIQGTGHHHHHHHQETSGASGSEGDSGSESTVNVSA